MSNLTEVAIQMDMEEDHTQAMDLCPYRLPHESKGYFPLKLGINVQPLS
jgi:hypothetical protein